MYLLSSSNPFEVALRFKNLSFLLPMFILDSRLFKARQDLFLISMMFEQRRFMFLVQRPWKNCAQLVISSSGAVVNE